MSTRDQTDGNTRLRSQKTRATQPSPRCYKSAAPFHLRWASSLEASFPTPSRIQYRSTLRKPILSIRSTAPGALAPMLSVRCFRTSVAPGFQGVRLACTRILRPDTLIHFAKAIDVLTAASLLKKIPILSSLLSYFDLSWYCFIYTSTTKSVPSAASPSMSPSR